MKRMMLLLVVIFFSLAGSGAAHEKKMAQSAVKTIIVVPNDIQWQAGPPAMPGAQMAVLEGDLSKPGFFVARLKLPAGARIAPHFHDNVERVTVISGTIKLAMGATQENPVLLPAGSYFSIKPKTVHNAWVEEETVVQISTRGPWTMHAVKGSK
ncbi:DUF4437 domain-containing protein [Geomonas terrae]|uniref:DUF4437 domain-containing protein n=1 Tax=Geomonas terrae TaxID=2562681 RepID=A0A4S1CDR4_9BACT|nr:cupin domain-containing protein [Geomonas terrae]TGU71567.1 DUF4437 domain-containing protein [Geomonas terrae]